MAVAVSGCHLYLFIFFYVVVLQHKQASSLLVLSSLNRERTRGDLPQARIPELHSAIQAGLAPYPHQHPVGSGTARAAPCRCRGIENTTLIETTLTLSTL